MEYLLLPLIFKIILVLFILSRIILMAKNILEENIFGSSVLQRVKKEK